MCGFVSYWKARDMRANASLSVRHLLVRREDDDLAVGDVAAAAPSSSGSHSRAVLHHVRRAADVARACATRLARVEAPRDLPRRRARPCRRRGDRPSRRAGSSGGPESRPVVVVRDAPQRRLDAAEDDGHARGTPGGRGSRRRCVARLGRAFGAAARRVLILAAHLLLRGELVEHRVEVARADADEEPRRAHARDVVGRVPVAAAR